MVSAPAVSRSPRRARRSNSSLDDRPEPPLRDLRCGQSWAPRVGGTGVATTPVPRLPLIAGSNGRAVDSRPIQREDLPVAFLRQEFAPDGDTTPPTSPHVPPNSSGPCECLVSPAFGRGYQQLAGPQKALARRSSRNRSSSSGSALASASNTCDATRGGTPRAETYLVHHPTKSVSTSSSSVRIPTSSASSKSVRSDPSARVGSAGSNRDSVSSSSRPHALITAALAPRNTETSAGANGASSGGAYASQIRRYLSPSVPPAAQPSAPNARARRSSVPNAAPPTSIGRPCPCTTSTVAPAPMSDVTMVHASATARGRVSDISSTRPAGVVDAPTNFASQPSRLSN